MIRFFRQIRLSMLNAGKTTRYFKYAIGEIILVVIGILIAFQVNSWNDARKNQAKKIALLKALQVEFSLNLTQLDSVIFYDAKVMNSTSRLLHLDPMDRMIDNTDSIRALVQNTGWLWTFDAQNGALRSGISSGDIHLIKNDSLINLLFGWPDVVADAKENEDRQIELGLNSDSVINRFVRSADFYGVISTEPGLSKFSSDYRALLNDPLFEDYIVQRNSHTFDAIIELKIVKNQNEIILTLIQDELNKMKQ